MKYNELNENYYPTLIASGIITIPFFLGLYFILTIERIINYGTNTIGIWILNTMISSIMIIPFFLIFNILFFVPLRPIIIKIFLVNKNLLFLVFTFTNILISYIFYQNIKINKIDSINLIIGYYFIGVLQYIYFSKKLIIYRQPMSKKEKDFLNSLL